MWPLSNRRSSTFSISKLGYLASRAPSAMFSRSRNAAMVASDALLDIQGSFVSKPVVVEAYADSLGMDGVGDDFMTQPALEQQQLTGRRGKGDPRAGLAFCRTLARRRGHESLQARILEFDPGRSLRHLQVVSAAERRMRVQVQAVHRASRHDVDPAVGHIEFAALQIPLDRRGKDGNVAFELFPQRLKSGRDSLETMHRTVGGVAARIVVVRPMASGRIVEAQLAALLQELAIEGAAIAASQG